MQETPQNSAFAVPRDFECNVNLTTDKMENICLSVNTLDENKMANVKFSKPEEIGFFSRDKKGNYKEDETSKKFLIKDVRSLQAMPLDLTFMPNQYRRFNEDKDTKPKILMWMKRNPKLVWDFEEHR